MIKRLILISFVLSLVYYAGASNSYKTNLSGGLGVDLATEDNTTYMLFARPDSTMKFGTTMLVGSNMTIKNSMTMPDRTTTCPTLLRSNKVFYVVFTDDQKKPRIATYRDSGTGIKYIRSTPLNQICVGKVGACILDRYMFLAWTNSEKFVVVRVYKIDSDGGLSLSYEKVFEDYLAISGISATAAGEYLFISYYDESNHVNISSLEIKGMTGGSISLTPAKDIRLDASKTKIDPTIDAAGERDVVAMWVDDKDEIVRLKWTGMNKSFLEGGSEERYNEKVRTPVGSCFVAEKLWLTYVDKNDEIQVVKYE